MKWLALFLGVLSSAPVFAGEATPEEILSDMLAEGSELLNEQELSSSQPRLVMEVFKRPKGLGINAEFAIVTVDGRFEKVYAVSTAMNGKKTIEGTYSLKADRKKGVSSSLVKAYPWHTSSTYNNSPMYWGLHIAGGYWVHSTPHYGQLGKPASMGCVRISMPDAMELWDMVVNRVAGSAQIRIYGGGSVAAKTAMNTNGINIDWLNAAIKKDLSETHAVSKKDFYTTAHARPGEALVIPSCEGEDCYTFFGKKKPLGVQ